MRLWKEEGRESKAEKYAQWEDAEVDVALIPYDVKVTRAHAHLLHSMGVLTAKEVKAVERALDKLLDTWKAGKFEIKDEDVHTAIIHFVMEEAGKVGKKLHAFRSRNEEVAGALRLLYKEQLEKVKKGLEALLQAVDTFVSRYGSVPLPGYTHTRKAMPSSVDMWAGWLREAMEDNLRWVGMAIAYVDRSPLGTGAGFGLPIKIDRALLAREAGFSKLLEYTLSAQNTRGKIEAVVIFPLLLIMADLNKMASDIIFLSLPELGCFELDEEITTGSSIMPHKKNPDPFEIMRAAYHTVLARMVEVASLPSNLISGYHRDFQLLKKPAIEALKATLASVDIAPYLLQHVKVNEEKCKEAITPEMHSVEEVYRAVMEGIPYLEAYLRKKRELKRHKGRS